MCRLRNLPVFMCDDQIGPLEEFLKCAAWPASLALNVILG